MGQTATMPASATETVVTEITLDKPIDADMFQLPACVKVQTMENPLRRRNRQILQLTSRHQL